MHLILLHRCAQNTKSIKTKGKMSRKMREKMMEYLVERDYSTIHIEYLYKKRNQRKKCANLDQIGHGVEKNILSTKITRHSPVGHSDFNMYVRASSKDKLNSLAIYNMETLSLSVQSQRVFLFDSWMCVGCHV